MKISRYFDSAVLKPAMTREEAMQEIRLAIALDSYSVCVRGIDIPMAVEMTKGTNTLVSCVLDFPYGYGGGAAKREMAKLYCAQGAKELDIVMPYGYARGGDWDIVREEVRAVVEEAHKANVLVKVIFETSQLTIPEIRRATEVCAEAGADFVKTSTGFNGAGATFEAVEAMLEAVQGRIQVKASGGIRDLKTARKYVEMGVTRLGVGVGSAEAIAKEENA